MKKQNYKYLWIRNSLNIRAKQKISKKKENNWAKLPNPSTCLLKGDPINLVHALYTSRSQMPKLIPNQMLCHRILLRNKIVMLQGASNERHQSVAWVADSTKICLLISTKAMKLKANRQNWSKDLGHTQHLPKSINKDFHREIVAGQCKNRCRTDLSRHHMQHTYRGKKSYVAYRPVTCHYS